MKVIALVFKVIFAPLIELTRFWHRHGNQVSSTVIHILVLIHLIITIVHSLWRTSL